MQYPGPHFRIFNGQGRPTSLHTHPPLGSKRTLTNAGPILHSVYAFNDLTDWEIDHAPWRGYLLCILFLSFILHTTLMDNTHSRTMSVPPPGYPSVAEVRSRGGPTTNRGPGQFPQPDLQRRLSEMLSSYGGGLLNKQGRAAVKFNPPPAR